eukprot:11023554-Alexandrium_andersonii.AAC.1
MRARPVEHPVGSRVTPEQLAALASKPPLSEEQAAAIGARTPPGAPPDSARAPSAARSQSP